MYSCLYTYMYVYIYVRVYLLIYFEIQRESERERQRERLRAHIDSRLFGKHSEARCEAPVFQLDTLSRNPETSTEAPRRCAPDGPAIPRVVASGGRLLCATIPLQSWGCGMLCLDSSSVLSKFGRKVHVCVTEVCTEIGGSHGPLQEPRGPQRPL